MAFKGANENPKLIAGKQMDYYANYYLGYLPEPVTNVHGYRKLTYKNLYDNIDLVLTRRKGEKGQEKLKYDIVVHPGGDLSEVKMAYKGMEGLSNRDGHLQITTSQGSITETIPESYWAESKTTAEVKYQVEGNVVSFQAQKEQKGQTLVVDPLLKWSTFLGGAGIGEDITIDETCNVYVTGAAQSGFPTTNGAYQYSYGGSSDAFLTKFTSRGGLSWSTYLGGSDSDVGIGVTTDDSGNVYVTGQAQSGFPTTNGAYQYSYGGNDDAFLSKFTSSGSLSWSTYLGESSFDAGDGVTIDDSGHLYVTGRTMSPGFPSTSGAYQDSFGGGNKDAFLSKFTISGSLSWSTYLGGSGKDKGWGVTTDHRGNVYVTGRAGFDFPTTSEAYQPSYGGGYYDGFLSKLNPPQKPNAGFASDSGCAGDTLRFVDASSIQGNDTITHYDWHLGDGDSASGRSVSHVYDTGGQYDVELIVATNKGRKDTATQPTKVHPVPQAAFEKETNVCVGDTLSITTNTQFKGSPDSLTYTWSLGNGDTLQTSEPEYAYETAGEYTVGLTVTSEKRCSSSESLPLKVGDTVSSAFTFEKVNNKAVSFDAASEDGQRYSWHFGDGVQSDSINPTHTYDSNRKYQVTLTVFNSDGCATTSTDSLELEFVGIDQDVNSKEINFSAYPSPFEQAVKVEYTLDEASEVRLEVFAADGRRVAAPLRTTQQNPGEYTYQLNLDDAKVSGVYLLQLTIDEKVYFKRIFKAK